MRKISVFLLKRSSKTKTRGMKMANLKLQDTIMVSFSLSKRKLVPAGIPEKVSRTRESMDARHVSQAFDVGRPDLVERGRLIDGQMTTGEQVLTEEKVAVAELEKSLLVAGYVLADIHWYRKDPTVSTKKNEETGEVYYIKPKFMVNATFTRLPIDWIPALPLIPAELTAPVWGLLCLWQNITGTTVVNLTARQPDLAPQYSLEVETNSFITRPL